MSSKSKGYQAGESAGVQWVKQRVLNGPDREMMERLEKFAARGRRLDATAPYGASGRLYFIMSDTDTDEDRDRQEAREFWEAVVLGCPYETHYDTRTRRCPPAKFVRGFIEGALKAWEGAKQAA